VNERKNVLQVPAAAVLDLGEGPVLYVVRDGKSAALHPKVGTPHAGWVEALGTDLKEGEPVIVEGGYNLPEATPVKLASEPTAAEGEAKDEAIPAKTSKDKAEPGAKEQTKS
jgi:hypothetical protein